MLLLFFADAWRSITKDCWILSVVRLDLDLELISNPIQVDIPTDIAMPVEMLDICKDEVASPV